MHYCKEAESCALGTVAKNMQQQMFAIMGKLTNMGQIVSSLGEIEDPSEMKVQMKQVGDGLGVIVRDLTGFVKTE